MIGWIEPFRVRAPRIASSMTNYDWACSSGAGAQRSHAKHDKRHPSLSSFSFKSDRFKRKRPSANVWYINHGPKVFLHLYFRKVSIWNQDLL